jgi:xanthine dehydrogenase small subunit
VEEARFAFGGMAAICARARGAEDAARGRAWNEDTVERTVAALAEDFTPIDDLRATADYRRKVAGNLLRRLWLETRDEAPSRTLRVWPVRAA